MQSKKKVVKSRKKVVQSSPSPRKCPKCGSPMIRGACTKCNYSSKTAYKSRREAKEFTVAAD